MKEYSDFRSDTVTKPTPEMRQALLTAEVGDDVFGEDPTINRLEEKLAAYFGQDAGLLCASGTMANQIAINVHTSPGDEVICDKLAHIYNYEGGGIARNSGASVRLLNGDRGRFTLEMVKANVNNPEDIHAAVTRLVAVEDTCNKGGGSCWDVEEISRLAEFCREKGLGFHLDGARLFNALVAKGHNPVEYGKRFDSISICLSKGLGAPVGSVLLGSKSFIHKARRVRKVFGGGMRQAGILAAAGLYALDHHVDRLAEDHRKAREVAEWLSDFNFVGEVIPPETNIVIFSVATPFKNTEVLQQLKTRGVLAVPFGPDHIRLVMHLDIEDEDLARLHKALKEVNSLLVP